MTELNVVAMALYSIVFMTLFMNIAQVFKESKELKAQGKTPLVGKNLTTVLISAGAELITIFGIVVLIEPFFTPYPIVVALLFIGLYLLRNVAAYVAAWGTWSVFVNLEKRKMQKELREDQEEAMF